MKSSYIDNLIFELNKSNKKENTKKRIINYAALLINNRLPVIFDPKHFSLLLGVEHYSLLSVIFTADDHYKIKIIKKRNGTDRIINLPSFNIREIQKWILNNILNNIPVSEHAMGFVLGKSIISNAEKHLNQECVLTIDIKDFFPSISIEQIFRIFYYYGYTKQMSYLFSKTCCYNGFLPQGAPTSPYLSNLICIRLDKRLSKLADKYQAKYTRYADDLTFSGSKNITNMLPIISEILRDESFEINNEKTRIQKNNQRQMVTGLVVNNDVPKVPKKFKKQLKQEIYFCKKYGFNNHQKRINDNHAFYKEHLYGKAYFVNMVEPQLGRWFLAELDEIDWDY